MYGGSFAESTAGMYAFSGVAGGLGSVFTGGNFWQGAATGLMVAGLNHAQHKSNKFFNRFKKHYDAGSGKDIKLTKDEFDYLISKGKINYANAQDIGDGFYKAPIDFYSSGDDLAYSFGKATVYYQESNLSIGPSNRIFMDINDFYNFNSLPWGTRSYFGEIVTRGYGTYGRIIGAKDFRVYYHSYKLGGR